MDGFLLVLLSGGADAPAAVGGFAANLTVFAIAFVAGYVLAVPLALLRFAGPLWLAAPLSAMAAVMRSVPVLLVAFWCVLLWPLLTGQPAAPLGLAALALSVYAAVSLSDMLLTGARAVPRLELEAARGLGMSQLQWSHAIVLPQMLRRSIRSSTSFATSLFKDTSILFMVGVSDVLHIAMIAAEREPSRLLYWYLVVAVCFILGCQLISFVGRALCARLDIHRPSDDSLSLNKGDIHAHAKPG